MACRRSELGDAVGIPPTAPEEVGTSESRLRQLMTQLLSRFSMRTAGAEQAARVVSLLLSIEAEAGRSLRFLDAFAVYFELAASTPLLGGEPGWPSVLDAYRRAIDRFLASDSFNAELRAIGAPWADLRHPPHPDALTAVSRILILADDAFTGYR